MVQAAAAHQLRSPIQGKQVSGSGSSMWPVLVLGILTAIFAWIWYSGSGETKEPETPVQKQEEVVDTDVTAERAQQSAESKNSPQAAHLASRESELNAADPDRKPNSSEQEVPCLEIQEKPEIYQVRNEQQLKIQVKEKGLSGVVHLKSGLEVQSSATANTNIPLTVQEEACVIDQHSDAQTKGEHPIDLPRKEELQADIPEHLTDVSSKGEIQADEQERSTDVPQERELEADIQEHPTDVPKKEEPPTDIQEHLTDITKKEELQADIQEHLTDITKKEELQADTQEHPTDVPQERELEADIQEHPTDITKKEELQADTVHPTDVPKIGELQADIQEHLTDITKKEELQADTVHPTDVPKLGELQADIQEHSTDVSKKGELEADIQEQPVDVQKKEEPPTDIQEHLTDITKKDELQSDTQEHPTDVPKKGELQADIQEQPVDVQKKGELQDDIKEEPVDVPKENESPTDMQEHLTDVSSKGELQGNILEQQTRVSVKENSLIEEHLKDLVQANKEGYKEISSKNDKVHSRKVNIHTSDTPEAVDVPLKKEVQLIVAGYPQDKILDQAVVQSKGEGMLPTQMAEEPEAQKLDDSCHTSISDVENGHGKEHPVNDSQDCVIGAKLTAENASGYPLENSFVAKETINQDLHVSINTSSDDGKAIVTDQVMSTSLQDNAEIFFSSLNESTPEGLSNVQELGTGPESSPVHIYNHMLNQENEIAGPDSSNTDEKTCFCSPSEANVNEIDYQKTRKVATIQPMPQNVNFTFRVHYITHSDSQIIAVTGDHEKLGKWEAYVPLTHGNGGFWSHSITLPADTNLLWKFVMVENGKIKRWEECNNRFLKTAHDDIEDELCWGYP